MKKTAILSLLVTLSILNMSSCGFFRSTFVMNIETAPPEIANQKELAESREAARQNAEPDTTPVIETTEDTETEPTGIAAFTDIPEDAVFYPFGDGQADVVYTENNAWVLDYVKNEVVPIINIEEMLAVADPANRAAEYFRDYRVELEFFELERGLDIIINVLSNSHDAAMKFQCYYLTAPRPNHVRGFGGYSGSHLKSYYPGCELPHSVDCVDRLGELGVTEISEFYAPVRAFLNCDIPALEAELYLEKGTLASWEGLVISDYTITRNDMNSPGVSNLVLDITVAESGLETLPVGEYTVTVDSGLFIDFDIKPKSGEEPRVLSDVERYIYTYASSFGGSFPPEYQNEENSYWLHCLLDFYSGETYEGFVDFCKYGFGIDDIGKYYSEDDFLNHGGHGLGTNLCRVRKDFTASGIHFITVDYFADPMETVIAFTHEFVVTETNDHYRLDEVRRTYDSGLEPFGWST